MTELEFGRPLFIENMWFTGEWADIGGYAILASTWEAPRAD